MHRSRVLVLGSWFLVACGGVDALELDLVPPSVVSITPAEGAVGVWLHQPIRIAFSEPLAPESTQGVTLSGPDGAGSRSPTGNR
ncbi:MAG: Ig-like domain-containing protein [bacterium]